MLTWQLPAITEPWTRDFESIYLELLGSQIRLVKGKKYTTRVIEAGAGEPLILLHGVGGTAESWFRNIRRLSADFHVCAIDQLFHGFSSKEAPGIQDRQEAMLDHLADFMDAMGFDKAHFEGESMGAGNAFRFALAHPDRVDRIILNTASPLVLALQGFRPPFKSVESLRHLSQAVSDKPNRRTVRTRLEWLMTTPDRVFDELVSVRLAFASMPELQAAQARPAGGGHAAPSGHAPTLAEECARIRAPTLVLWSQYNPDSGPDRGEHLAKLIQGAKYYCMADAAHWPQYEHPEEHDRVVTDFLKGPART